MTRRKKSGKKWSAPVTVNSLAYGRHERAARGSKSRVHVNEAMKGYGRRMLKSNMPASLIMDALRPFRDDFRGGLLWQRLVSHFAAQANEGKEYSVSGINDWELNDRHPTSRIMSPNLEVRPKDDFSTLEVTLNYWFADRFLKRKKDITAFRITLIFLFPDFENNEIITEPFVLPDKLLTDKVPYVFIVQLPRNTSSYLICFKAQPCVKGILVESSGNVDKAMCLIGSGTRD